MKTKPFQPAVRPILTLDGVCKIFTGGQELEFSMLGALYAAVTLARRGAAQEVFYQDGTLLLRHDGTRELESVKEFGQAVVAFSEFMLEEQKRGYELYQRESSQGLATATAEALPPT